MNHCCGRQKKQVARSGKFFALRSLLPVLTLLAPASPKRLEESIMIKDDIKQLVKSRYGKFAEAGSPKESC